MKKSLSKAIGSVMVVMILSRLLALVSNQTYISFYGTENTELNIYSYAIAIPNVIFNCFGTALSTVVIPIFAGLLATKGKNAAERFASGILTVSMLLITLLAGVGMLLSSVIPKFTEFADTESSYQYAVMAIRIMMPVMFFYGINYIFQGILQSIGQFRLPAAVSIPSSLTVMLYVFLIATFIGLALQAIILIPPVLKAGYRFRFLLDFKDESMRRALKMTLPVLIGVSAYQLNMFFNITMMANFENRVTLLSFVQNLVLYSVLAIAYSVTAVIYPELSRLHAEEDKEGYKKTLSSSISDLCFLLLPATVGLILMREPFLAVISGYGQVTEGDIAVAGTILLMYSIGLCAIGVKEILDRAFYAMQNTKIPAIAGFVVMGTNVVLSLSLIRFMNEYGIPLAYSISSLVGTGFLYLMLRRKYGGMGNGLKTNLLKCTVSALVMGVCVFFLRNGMNALLPDGGLIGKLVRLFVPTLVGIVVYFALTILLRVPTITEKLKRGAK